MAHGGMRQGCPTAKTCLAATAWSATIAATELTVPAMNPVEAASRATIPPAQLQAWRDAEPQASRDFAADQARFGDYWRMSHQLIERLPPKRDRDEAQAAVAEQIHGAARKSRERFLRQH